MAFRPFPPTSNFWCSGDHGIGTAGILPARRRYGGKRGGVDAGLRPACRLEAAAPIETRLSWQFARAHQEFVDGAGALAAFADGPDNQRLAAPHVAGGE